MAVAVAAAFFARKKVLLWAAWWLVLSNVLTRLWMIGLAEYTFGYAVIDLALLALFVERRRGKGGVLLVPLIWVQIAFMALHLAGALFDFSGLFAGEDRSHAWMEAWLRNRLFELSLAWIIGASTFRLMLKYSTSAQRIARESLRH